MPNCCSAPHCPCRSIAAKISRIHEVGAAAAAAVSCTCWKEEGRPRPLVSSQLPCTCFLAQSAASSTKHGPYTLGLPFPPALQVERQLAALHNQLHVNVAPRKQALELLRHKIEEENRQVGGRGRGRHWDCKLLDKELGGGERAGKHVWDKRQVQAGVKGGVS